jgi:hypothetical protein
VPCDRAQRTKRLRKRASIGFVRCVSNEPYASKLPSSALSRRRHRPARRVDQTRAFGGKRAESIFGSARTLFTSNLHRLAGRRMCDGTQAPSSIRNQDVATFPRLDYFQSRRPRRSPFLQWSREAESRFDLMPGPQRIAAPFGPFRLVSPGADSPASGLPGRMYRNRTPKAGVSPFQCISAIPNLASLGGRHNADR